MLIHRDMASQLDCLHKSGTTHGDLKPQNVLIFKGIRGLCAKLSYNRGTSKHPSYYRSSGK